LADPDDAALRDYILHGLGKSPLAFARNYYAHYPKLAIGHWPPVFYVAQALWIIMFPATRNSVLVMMALVTAMLAAWCGSLALLALPGVMASDGKIMTEIP
jgi:hypothetical protein